MTAQTSQRFLCTKETPWTPDIKGPVAHRDTQEVGDQQDGWPGGDIIRVRCKNCGHSWTEELPQ